MKHPHPIKHPYDDPTIDEQFYARALGILVGPGRTVAAAMRICNVVYWVAVTLALVWLFAQALDRAPPVQIRAADLLTPEVVAGDAVHVRYDVKRRRTCETDVSYMIIDSNQEVHRFGPKHIEAPGKPGEETMVNAWPTSANLAPGPSRLRVILAFECPGNYLQAIYPVTMVLDDVPFTMLGRRVGRDVFQDTTPTP